MNAVTKVESQSKPQIFIPSVSLITSDKYEGIRNKSEIVIQNILSIIKSGKSCSVGVSHGKDSSVLLVLAIEALKRAISLGIHVSGFHVTHSDTEVENPALGFYCASMNESLQKYSDDNNLNIQLHIVYPELTSSYIYNVIGRGRLPVFPGKQRHCTVDMKINPQLKGLKKVLKQSGGINNHVSLIGTRLSESADRKERMIARGETSISIVADDKGNLTNAPIADWELTDVWELLMSIDEYRGDSLFETYVKNFEWTLELYKSANEGTCAIIVGDKGNRSPCSSRFGCGVCAAVGKTDKSLTSMIENEPDKYGYMTNLNKLRNYIVDTQHDNSLRTIFGQTISPAGYINCRPDNYNGKMRERLLSYFLTLDQDERERAELHNEKWCAGELEKNITNDRLRDIQFEFVSFEKLAAIDFIWSVQCVSEESFPAFRVWYNIVELGRRYYAPVLSDEEIKHDKIPSKRFLYVGDTETLDGNDGLRNIYLEATNGRRGKTPYKSYMDKKTGQEHRMAPHQTADRLTIDKEEACAFITCEYPEIYNQVSHDNSRASMGFLLDQGIIKICKGKARTYDNMARRYQHLHGMLLTFNTFDDEGELFKETISEEEHGAILEEMGLGLAPAIIDQHEDASSKVAARDKEDQMALF